MWDKFKKDSNQLESPPQAHYDAGPFSGHATPASPPPMYSQPHYHQLHDGQPKYSQGPQQGYYGYQQKANQPGWGPPQQRGGPYGSEPQPQMYYAPQGGQGQGTYYPNDGYHPGRSSGAGAGICAVLMSALACCCCLQCGF